MILTCVILIVVGFGVGLLSGLLGVGGGTLLVPIYSIGLGMTGVQATGTSLFTIIPTSLSGMVTHIRGKTAVAKVGFSMGLGGAIASPLGVKIASMSPEWLVVAAVALVILYSGITSLQKALKPAKATQAASAADATASAPTDTASVDDASATTGTASTGATASDAAGHQPQTPDEFEFTGTVFVKSVLIGLVAGVAAGYVGLGGGFIMVPLMSSLLNFPMRLASGTSLVAIMCIAIPGSVAQGMLGNIDYVAALMIACGSIPGAAVGARYVKKFNDRTLRFMFAGLLLVAAVLLVVKQLGILG